MCTKKKKCTIVQLKTISQSQLYARAHPSLALTVSLSCRPPAHLSGPCIIHRQEQLIFNGPHFNKRPREIIFSLSLSLSTPTRRCHLSNFDRIVRARAHQHVRFRVPTFFTSFEWDAVLAGNTSNSKTVGRRARTRVSSARPVRFRSASNR